MSESKTRMSREIRRLKIQAEQAETRAHQAETRLRTAANERTAYRRSCDDLTRTIEQYKDDSVEQLRQLNAQKSLATRYRNQRNEARDALLDATDNVFQLSAENLSLAKRLFGKNDELTGLLGILKTIRIRAAIAWLIGLVVVIAAVVTKENYIGGVFAAVMVTNGVVITTIDRQMKKLDSDPSDQSDPTNENTPEEEETHNA